LFHRPVCKGPTMRHSLSRLSVYSAVALIGCAPAGGGTSPDTDAGAAPIPTCTIDGVELRKPLEHATTHTGGVPDLSCVDNPAALAASETITAEGCVDIFGLGGKAKGGLKIAFYDVDQDAKTEEPAYGTTDILTKAGGSAEAAECSKEGWYRKEGLPTNKPLTVKVYDSATGFSQTAIPTYTYYKIFDAAAVEDGVYEYEANLVYKTTYDSIPTLGGRRVDGQTDISDGVGRGVIAGEVHDCKGALVKHASVSTSRVDSSTRVAYFNGDLDDPTPDLAMTATNTDALFAVLNAETAPGTNDHNVVAAILDPACTEEDPAECDCVKAGAATINVYPDSVSILSPEGTFPEAQ
ncbi:MAG: hypothetical protein ACO3JL_18955, partial [Myxococcota bacterium]